MFPSGELHIRNVSKADEFQSYHCETRHDLTQETAVSAAAGRYSPFMDKFKQEDPFLKVFQE